MVTRQVSVTMVKKKKKKKKEEEKDEQRTALRHKNTDSGPATRGARTANAQTVEETDYIEAPVPQIQVPYAATWVLVADEPDGDKENLPMLPFEHDEHAS